jgi:hypothetical protein
MTSANSGAGTAYPSGAHEFTSVFTGVRVTRSLVLCVMFCRLFFFFYPLCCLSFFDLRILWYLQTLLTKLIFMYCCRFMIILFLNVKFRCIKLTLNNLFEVHPIESRTRNVSFD